MDPLEQFREQAGLVGRAMVDSAGKIESRSRACLVPTGTRPPVSFFLSAMGFHWRFYVTIGGTDRRILFFFRKKGDPKPLIHADVDFRIVPTGAVLLEARPRTDLVHLSILRPPFVVPRPSQQQRLELVSENATERNSILLRTGTSGQEFLGVIWIGGGLKFRYTARRGAQPIDFRPSDRSWPVAPVLSLIEAIGAWVSRDFEQGQAQPFEPSAAQDSQTLALLDSLVETYRELLKAATKDSQSAFDIARGFETEYGVEELRARVLLRLRRDGTLAIDSDEEDPFSLLLSVNIKPEGQASLARLAIGPPDFLVSGPVFDAFVKAIDAEAEDNRLIRSVRDELRRSQFGVDDEEAIRRLLSDRGSYHSILRVKRKDDEDTDLVVLKGNLVRRPALVFLEGRFVVRASQDPPTVEIKPRSLGCLYAGSSNSPEGVLGGDLIDYFKRLVTQIRFWIGSLA